MSTSNDSLNPDSEVIDPVYLPFSASILRRHFAPIMGRHAKPAGDHVSKYVSSAQTYRKFLAMAPNRDGVSMKVLKTPCQIEKDEKFWTAACWLQLFYSPKRTASLSNLMRACFGKEPPIKAIKTWQECFDGDLHLFFEANLPSPPSYKRWLKENMQQRNLVPYVLHAANRTDGDFEGPTHVDAVLINASNGFSILVEAKVISDIGYHIDFDMARNQIARTLDVALESNRTLAEPLCRRDPEKTLVLLQTPLFFKTHRHTRLYGWILESYLNDVEKLPNDLPHRSNVEWSEFVKRIGWITWEDCEAILPGCCKWLLKEHSLARQGQLT